MNFEAKKSLFSKKHEKYLIFIIGNMYDFLRKMCFFDKIFEKSQFSPLEIWINFCQKMTIFLVKKKVTHFIHIWEEWWKWKKHFFGNYQKSAEFKNRDFPDIWVGREILLTWSWSQLWGNWNRKNASAFKG